MNAGCFSLERLAEAFGGPIEAAAGLEDVSEVESKEFHDAVAHIRAGRIPPGDLYEWLCCPNLPAALSCYAHFYDPEFVIAAIKFSKTTALMRWLHEAFPGSFPAAATFDLVMNCLERRAVDQAKYLLQNLQLYTHTHRDPEIVAFAVLLMDAELLHLCEEATGQAANYVYALSLAAKFNLPNAGLHCIEHLPGGIDISDTNRVFDNAIALGRQTAEACMRRCHYTYVDSVQLLTAPETISNGNADTIRWLASFKTVHIPAAVYERTLRCAWCLTDLDFFKFLVERLRMFDVGVFVDLLTGPAVEGSSEIFDYIKERLREAPENMLDLHDYQELGRLWKKRRL